MLLDNLGQPAEKQLQNVHATLFEADRITLVVGDLAGIHRQDYRSAQASGSESSPISRSRFR